MARAAASMEPHCSAAAAIYSGAIHSRGLPDFMPIMRHGTGSAASMFRITAAKRKSIWGAGRIHGVAGAEVGTTGLGTITTDDFETATTTTATTLVNTTRFFDKLDVSYYLTDNWKASIGHRYLAGSNALALGTEYALPVSAGIGSSLFAEARLGEGSNALGIWGGARFYFGDKTKSLIRRNREDDPVSGGSEAVFGLVNTHLSSTSKCTPPAHFVPGAGCLHTFSDIRLKRDIGFITRLDSGIAIYRYRYLWSDTVYVGVMAQEVLAIVPDAVMIAEDGFYRVDYARLGLRMLTWDEWIEAGCNLAALSAVPASLAIHAHRERLSSSQ